MWALEKGSYDISLYSLTLSHIDDAGYFMSGGCKCPELTAPEILLAAHALAIVLKLEVSPQCLWCLMPQEISVWLSTHISF